MVLLALLTAGLALAAAAGETVALGDVPAVAAQVEVDCAIALIDKPARNNPSPNPLITLRTFTFIP